MFYKFFICFFFQVPSFVLEIKPPAGVVLAADYQYNSIYELEGDVQALRLIDLDREGLSEYKQFVQRLGLTQGEPVVSSVVDAIKGAVSSTGRAANETTTSPSFTEEYSATNNEAQGSQTIENSLISEIFDAIDRYMDIFY